MRTSATAALAGAVTSLVLAATATAQAPTCATSDLSGRSGSRFRPGAEFVVKGGGLAPNELVLVTFRQPPDAIELARYKTDGQGAFTSQPRIIRIPTDASGGRAAIQLASSRGSATCDVEIVGVSAAPSPTPAAEDERDLEPWLIAWATLLVLGALGLGYVRVRRWRQAELERQMSRLPRTGRRLGE